MIAAFCQRWRIVELSLFGSAARGELRPDSDIDLLLVFDQESHPSLFDLIDMQQELRELLGREVDLVEKDSLVNPFRRAAILAERRLLYAT